MSSIFREAHVSQGSISSARVGDREAGVCVNGLSPLEGQKAGS